MTDQPPVGWHFLAEDGYTRFEPRIKVEVGQTLTVDPPLKLCCRGLHASVRAIDALYYAPGPIVCRVELSGEILSEYDKVCAQHRKVLWMANATRVLHLFACDEAERALQFAGITDPCCLAAIETKRRWVDNKATIGELRTARAFALSTTHRDIHSANWYAALAAQAAAQSDAHVAALSTVYAAVQFAARSAAPLTDWYANQSAAWYAAWYAALPGTDERLTAALMQLQPGETS